MAMAAVVAASGSTPSYCHLPAWVVLGWLLVFATKIERPSGRGGLIFRLVAMAAAVAAPGSTPARCPRDRGCVGWLPVFATKIGRPFARSGLVFV